jgi:vacuolar-type H+-ATPase subunit I/STV1
VNVFSRIFQSVSSPTSPTPFEAVANHVRSQQAESLGLQSLEAGVSHAVSNSITRLKDLQERMDKAVFALKVSDDPVALKVALKSCREGDDLIVTAVEERLRNLCSLAAAVHDTVENNTTKKDWYQLESVRLRIAEEVDALKRNVRDTDDSIARLKEVIEQQKGLGDALRKSVAEHGKAIEMLNDLNQRSRS